MLGSDNLAKKKRVKKKAKRLATFGIVSSFLIVIISITLLGVFSEIINKYQERDDLLTKLTLLEEKEKELQNNVEKLQDPEYLARYAREKYFYSKDGELIIRIPENDE